MKKKFSMSADYEYVKEKSLVYFKNKINTDADFAKAEKERVKEYKKNGYANDAEYREKIQEKAQENYKKKSLKKQGNKKN